MALIWVLNGPNLNLLGLREPGLYGMLTLKQIEENLQTVIQKTPHKLVFLQTNAEAELVGWIQQAFTEQVDFILINPAAFTHTSIALRDALLAVKIPFIELHLSNIHAREPFRHHSYLSDIAKGVIVGFGAMSYELALQAALNQLSE